MKRIIALLLMFCLLLGVGSVTGFASPPIFEVSEHWKTNVVIFYNANDVFDAATICYCADGSESWQSAEMTYGGLNEYGEDSWYFTMPQGKYNYYITDGTHRTKEEYFTGEILLYLLNETDENGNYDLYLDMISVVPDPAAGELYKDSFKEYYGIKDYDPETGEGDLMDYRELYYHENENGETDWVLLYARMCMMFPATFRAILGNRVFDQWNTYTPFYTGYGIYDVEKETVVDLCDPYQFDADSYSGWKRAVDQYGFRESDANGEINGRLLGDLDGDDELSILDVTLLRRCDVKLCDWPENDEIGADFGKLTRFSDFNRDGGRDILDATCLQRYLADLPYQVG